MTFAALLNQPLIIERRSGVTTDEYGNEVAGTTATIVTTGYVEQTKATEVTVDRKTYVTTWRVFLRTGEEIDGSDRIAFGSRVLEVVGSPHEVWNPRTASYHHIEARCREVVG